MDLCAYAYYKPEEKYMPYLYCNIDDKRCVYSKKCMKVERFIPLENEMWKECYKFIMQKKKIIPKDSYFVQTYRPNKSNNKLILYVIVDDKVQRIQSNFTELNQDYVYLKENGSSYDISLYPFSIENIVTTTDNENNEPVEIEIENKEEIKTISTSTGKKRGRKPKNKSVKEK